MTNINVLRSIFVLYKNEKIMKTSTQYFIQEAENARSEFVAAKNAALDYAGCKSVKSLKKDTDFIKLTNKMVAAKKLWYDYNAAALIQARGELIND